MRWLSPLAVVALIAAIAVVPPALATTPPPPSLPQLSAHELLTRVQTAKPPQALSGSMRLTTNLGIPNLGELGGHGASQGFDVFSLLSGSHEARVWFDGPERVRVALPDQLAETDVIRNGRDLWVWQSAGSRVTHSQLDAAQAGDSEATGPVTTPDKLAKQFLDKIDPSTAVSVQSPVWVAKRSAYQLTLSPRAVDSTIGQVAIAVDSATSYPLRVTVTAKGATKPAFTLGFTGISFSRPSPSTFAFSPPPGSHEAASALAVPERGRHQRAYGPAAGRTGTTDQQVVGQDWTSIVIARLASSEPWRDQSGVSLPGESDALLKAAAPVPGGRLLKTPLINILLLDDGRIAVGAVTPAALQAAVASAH